MSYAFPPGRWRSRWIWADDAPGYGTPRHTVALRTTIDLDRVPATVPARLCAQGRYVLFVNGVRVAQGPVRANPRKQPYDDLDLAPHLRPGPNVIATLVVRFAGATAWYLPPPDFSNDLVLGAFVLEADLGEGRWLTTTADRWQGRVLDGWGATQGGGVSGRGTEQVDARSLPVDWATGETVDWPAAIERAAMTVGEPGRQEPPTYPIGPFGPRPISWPTATVVPLRAIGDGDHVVDRVSVGTVVVDAEGPAGSVVTIRPAEFLDGGRPAPTHHDAAVAFTLDGTRRIMESLDSYGLTGVQVDVPAGVTLHGLSLHERVHPVAGDASFECSDPRLEEIWAVGRRTVSICSMDTYLDCPTREQRAWTGDSVVHQLVDLTTNTDWTLARWHPRMAASPRPDGMLPMACAGDAEQADFTIIPDWALHWVHSVWNLHRYLGDRDEIARLLPVVEGVVRWFEPFLDDEGLPTDVYAWVIIDWSSVYTEGVSATLCGLWGRALLEFAEMADWLGDHGRAAWARSSHERLQRAFERLWDESAQRYVDSWLPGQRRPMASQHGQAAAIVGRLAPEARWARLIDVITDEANLIHANFSEPDREAPPDAGWDVQVGGYLRDGHPAPWWDVERQVVRAQPFFRYVVHDALVEAGRGDVISSQLLDWQWALDRCPTSLTETWYGGTISHGWSATPTRDAMQRILGVTPAQPGFAVAAIDPHLGHLEWAKGSVPTPAGPLEVDVRAGQLTVDSPIPVVIRGESLPAGRHVR